MMKRNIFAALAIGMITSMAAQAQDFKPYWYVEAQGGVQLTSTNAPMDKLITPTAAISVGRFFTPVVGARLHVNAWQSKSGFKDLDQYYKWKYITPDLDLMLNLTNLFCPSKPNHFLNVMLLGGVGLNYAWDNDELAALNVPYERTPLVWKDNRLSHNLRAGLRLETDMTKRVGVSLEVNANSLSDRFNSKNNDADDWMFTAMLGINVRLGGKCKKSEPAPEPVVEPVVEPEPAPVVEKKAVIKQEPVKIHKVIYYAIRANENNQMDAILNEVAAFAKQYKDVKITACGYADKGTGNPKLNVMYAKKRADKVKADLTAMGVNGDILSVDSKGDAVQPFPENDRNRCVIIDGEGVKEYTVYE